MTRILRVLVLSTFFLIAFQLCAQQVLDSTFTCNLQNPLYPFKKGPVIFIDEYHNNDMSIKYKMTPLLKILESDGYRIKPFNDLFNEKSLENVGILVVIGALHKSNVKNWELPTPSAFSNSEIENLLRWIDNGGNFLLVADHMPFPGAVKKLSRRLGVEWYNGFVIDSINWGISTFSVRKGTLKEHSLTKGYSKDLNVETVSTYYGSGFEIENSTITGLLSFDNPNIVSYQTREAWRMSSNTPIIPSDLLYQAAIINRGKGRVVLVGEASLFSAQLIGKDKNPIGLNYPNNGQNIQFVLNIFHWLSRKID